MATNRARLHVDLEGPWQRYQPACPAGWHILGTVRVGESDETVGALARSLHTGLYVRMVAGLANSLDQRKVAAALRAIAQIEA